MQHQPNLTTLGLARLELFRSLTLPSMEAQTNRNFVWMIRTDPMLVPALRNPLLETLRKSSISDRIVLMGSNDNPVLLLSDDSGDKEARDGRDSGISNLKDKSSSTQRIREKAAVWLGNSGPNPLLQKHSIQQDKEQYVLDTWLDADDALPNDFVDLMQRQATKQMVLQRNFEHDSWLLWCSYNHYEWHLSPPKGPHPEKTTSASSPSGVVQMAKSKTCITPGLTLGYRYVPAVTNKAMLPKTLWHVQLDTMYPYCDNNDYSNENGDPSVGINAKNRKRKIKTKCLRRIYVGDEPGSLRARTLTSAGMKNVVLPSRSNLDNTDGNVTTSIRGSHLRDEAQQHDAQQEELWRKVERVFGVSKDSLRRARSVLLQQSHDIATENLMGQCTRGHSCKNSTQEQLRRAVQQKALSQR